MLVAMLAGSIAAGCGSALPVGTPLPAQSASATPADPTATAALSVLPAPTPLATTPRVVFAVRESSLRLPVARSRAVALVLGSRILLVGGLSPSGTTDSIVSLSPGSGRIAATGRLRTPVHDAGGTTIGGAGYVFGGGRFGPGSLVQRVDGTGRTTTVGHLPAIRADLSSVTVGAEMAVVGGGTPARPDRQVLATSDGKRFRVAALLPVAVRYPAVVAVDRQIYVIGGATPSGDTRVIQVVDLRTGAARIVGRLSSGLSHASAFAIGDTVLLAGGRSGGRAQDGLWQLDRTGRSFVRVGRLPYAVSDAAVAVLHGVGYIIGGEGRRLVASVIAIGAP